MAALGNQWIGRWVQVSEFVMTNTYRHSQAANSGCSQMTGTHTNRSPLNKEWGIFALFMLCVAALLSYPNGLGQVDRFIYDNLIKATQRPAPENIVIIAIDDVSIESIGRWPWSRATHARLLNTLAETDVNAIGMDIIFSEASTLPEEDIALAASIARTRTVLPVLIERGISGPRTTLPLPELRSAAKNLGHIHFTFDADGVVRSVYMRDELRGASWPQFALSVVKTGPASNAMTPIKVRPNGRANITGSDNSLLSHIFKNETLERIPFSGAPGHFQTVSYIDVLAGKIPASFFSKKYVLIGATAAGIAPTFATSVTTDHRAMSGVEINANILAGLIEGRSIHDAALWAIMLLTLVSTLLALIVCRTFSPFFAFGASALLVGLISVFTYAAFIVGLWVPPAAAILIVIAVYPVWSWRRLEAALRYLNEEFTRLNLNTSAIILRTSDASIKEGNFDFLDKQITAMRIAADRSRDMHQFVIDNLNSMPDATLVLSQSGKLLMANRVARSYFSTIGLDGPEAPTLESIFAKFDPYFETNLKRSNWRDTLLQSSEDVHKVVEIETRDINKREFLIKSAPSFMLDNSMLGWIISLVDVTTLRAAERRREESLNFISHDMRVPQSSILALIQLQKNSATAFPLPEFLGRIEKSVETTLNLADNFVHLAKAESQAYQLQDADFPSILADAADDMWAFAHSKSIEIVINAQVENYWINVDRSLLVRAIGNLLSNAIKFSPSGSQVICTVRPLQTGPDEYVICSIADQGKGISASEHNAIFSPFQRADEQGRDGVGLGLAFVKMVIERHGGAIEVDSAPGKGSIFTLTLPCVIGAGESEMQYEHDHASMHLNLESKK